MSRIYLFLLTLAILGFISKADGATYVVDRADDAAGATACTAAANDCSLRGAIINANANGAGADIIQFNVLGGNSQTITMSSTELPEIQTSLTIDGTSQPLWAGFPLIEINGAASTAGTDGFRISSPIGNIPITVVIKSLTINRFKGSGIYFRASSGINATVVGCYIGTDPGGSIDRGNEQNGIRIDAYPDSSFSIGGTATSERNIISGNNFDGIDIATAMGFDIADTTITVLNNFIGTTSAGNTDLGNSSNGIDFHGASFSFGYSLQVGNGLGNGRNVISGNDAIGIGATTGTVTIMGNYIGTSLNGNADLGNTLDGIQIAGTVVNATIGGTVLGIPVGNVISGNNRMGIWINAAAIPATIRGNKIGTNAAGTAALGNSSDGIFLYENDTFTDSTITIGSETEPLDKNVISGNGGDGIEISEKVRQVKIFGNYIGTNDSATAKIANAIVGIRIQSAQNEVGAVGNDTSANIISGNESGIFLISSTASGNKIFKNFIGTNPGGSNLGNLNSGIYINQSALGNQIGNGLATGTNTIAYNGGIGVNVADGTINSIRANSIYSNAELGIDLNSNGITPNDHGDADSGPNSLQNFPVIQLATPTRITGYLDSSPDTSFSVDFYRSELCDPTGYGEGRYYLGTQTVLTDPLTGIGAISFPTTLTVGQFVTATATRVVSTAGDTSEFSQCIAITGEPGNISFSAAAYTTSESSGFRTIVVNRTGGSTGMIRANYATSNGTATAGQDYTSASGTLTFLDGEVVKSFDIPIANDTLNELDETINLTLSNASPGVFLTPNSTAVLTILDNDPQPVFAIEDVSMNEGNIGNNQFSFRVSLSAASGLPVSVDYVTAQGTATASSDFIPTSGQVNFAPGETLKNILVPVIGDLTPELDETFSVDLSNPVNALFGDAGATGTIVDDDNPGKFSFAFAPYSGTEHDSVAVTVSRTNGTAGTVSVDYATSGGTATPNVDYTPVSGTLVFADGETTKTFNVSLGDDLIAEPTETVNLVLSNPIGGTTLGAPSAAVLTIFDNDSGTLLNLAGEVISSVDHSPIANVTLTLQGAQNATTTTDSLGKYSFSDLAPNSNYSVTPSALGYTFNPINYQFTNLVNDDLNVNFVATAAPSRQLRIIGGNTTPGQNVSVNVELVAQGDENSLGFSINYDPFILSNPNVSLGADALNGFLTVNSSQSGKVGVLLALPAGESFSAGTKQVIGITLSTAATNLFSTPLTFGNSPIAGQVVNSNADPLPTNYLDGAVSFAQGFEADVAPRPTGSMNGFVTVADFSQIGKFVAGIDSPDLPTPTNEFQRADCAPRVSLGNGVLTVSDYTQAGRYAAGLDPVSPTGGAFSANFASFTEKVEWAKLLGTPSVVRVVNAQTSPSMQVTVSIATDAQGTENGFGFSLNYDANKLSNPLVQKGADTQAATLIPNVNQSGRIGVILAMPAGQTIAGGERELVTVRFDVASNASAGQTPLTFSDLPAFREIVDANADPLPSEFHDGFVNILGPTAANVTIGGRIFDSNGRGVYGARVSIIDQNGNAKTVISNPFGYYRLTEIASGNTYIIDVRHKTHQFSQQVITVFEDAAEVNFTALE